MNADLEYRLGVSRYYDVAQRFYDRFWYMRSGWGIHYGFWTPFITDRVAAIANENRILARWAGIKQGDLVLDAGCGVGGSGLSLVGSLGATVIGINITHNQLIRARSLTAQNGLSYGSKFVEGDYHDVPLKDGSVNIYWSLESFEHVRNAEKFVREAFRVLKPGGTAMIAATFKGRDKLSDEEQRQINVGLTAANAFSDFRTAKQVVQIMEDVGFEVKGNVDVTDLVIESAHQMRRMCLWGYPLAIMLGRLGYKKEKMQLIAHNNLWGIYQEGLFRSGATSYNVIIAKKPVH